MIGNPERSMSRAGRPSKAPGATNSFFPFNNLLNRVVLLIPLPLPFPNNPLDQGLEFLVANGFFCLLGHLLYFSQDLANFVLRCRELQRFQLDLYGILSTF